MWKALLLATVATIGTANAAEQYTIHARPDTVVHWPSPVPFKTIIVGGAYEEEKEGENKNVITASSHGSNVDLYLNIKDPRDWIGGTNLFLLDADGKVVAELRVIITPTGKPMHRVFVYRNGTRTSYLLCNDPQDCEPYIGRKPREATAEETTRHPDGSVTTRREL